MELKIDFAEDAKIQTGRRRTTQLLGCQGESSSTCRRQSRTGGFATT